MTKTKANYGRIHFLGSVVFAVFFALLPAVLVYQIGGTKVGAVLVFFPAVILLTRLLLWTQERAMKENANSVRRRYEDNNVVPSQRRVRPEVMAAYRRSNEKYRELYEKLAK